MDSREFHDRLAQTTAQTEHYEAVLLGWFETIPDKQRCAIIEYITNEDGKATIESIDKDKLKVLMAFASYGTQKLTLLRCQITRTRHGL